MRIAQNIALLILAAACGINSVSAAGAADAGEDWTFIDLPVRAAVVPGFAWGFGISTAVCVFAVVAGTVLDRKRATR